MLYKLLSLIYTIVQMVHYVNLEMTEIVNDKFLIILAKCTQKMEKRTQKVENCFRMLTVFFYKDSINA